MEKDFIFIKGAKEHNLKNIDLKLPRNKLIVITGLSGSGKSSLAFDTIYAEGQRRYVESLSSYARQFLEQLQKPDVDYIEGLSPAISIEQRNASSNPRSTVGTQTEIYDYLRLLFARIGIPHCPKCGKKIEQQSAEQIVDQIFDAKINKKIAILAVYVRGKKGEHKQIFSQMQKEGFIRARIDGKIYGLEETLPLNKKIKHSIEAVVDRITVEEKNKKRIVDSIELALKISNGVVIVGELSEDTASIKNEKLFSEHYGCVTCGISLEKPEPRIFSFNSPYGACPVCHGLGNKMEIDPDLIVPDPSKPLITAISPWKIGGKGLIIYYRRLLRSLLRNYKIDVNSPFKDLPKDIRKIILYGDPTNYGFEGVIPNLERRFHETDSEYIKEEINKYMSVSECPECKGARLRKESLAVKIENVNINDINKMSILQLKYFFDSLKLTDKEKTISEQILKEIKARLEFMVNVGLDYLTLDRRSSTLSGGESQRIRLATQIGSGLVGVIYILDEPSIGLHQKDNAKLLNTLRKLRDLGNTLIVVEHDETTIRTADYIVDLGPGAGENGGYIVASGGIEDINKSVNSLTGQYLRGELKIPVPVNRRKPGKDYSLIVKGAQEHNLKNIDIEIPLGLFNCVTGVSGSGKSTLVYDILYRALAKKFYRAKEKPGEHLKILGTQFIDKVVVIDQSPIGRTPRSNPATYTGLFTPIRDFFSRLPESKLRGYKIGRFSFNVKGGRCEACSGDGLKKIEMHFLPDVYVTCEVCKGRRYNGQTLEVKYKGYSIADVLDLSVFDALKLFSNMPRMRAVLQTLNDVGLGYVKLGQSATTLSGGEAQRIKLATELSKRATGKTLYILDEPTTGLHFADIHKLLTVLHRLVDAGNTVIVIEHNLDVIKNADYIIDLGPDGGDKGGFLVASCSPEKLVKNSDSYTASFLKKVIN